MSRIHAACRASTDTIAHALASRSGVRFVIWPFSAATAASSSTMAFATKASWSVSASPTSNVGAGAAGVAPSAAWSVATWSRSWISAAPANSASSPRSAPARTAPS